MEQEPKITTGNKIRLIISLSTIAIFIVVAFITSIHNSDVCEPEHSEIAGKLKYISKYYNSIKDIRLVRSSPGWQVNLVSDTLLITDPLILKKIRQMINNRKVGEWNHPTDRWEVALIADMNNNETLKIRVCKINNDTLKQMTHLYFASPDCVEEQPQYSLELGDYLEYITRYPGFDYK